MRLKAAAGLFELGFGPRHVPQQCVQLLRTQYQQSEHKYEQDFGTQPHDSLLRNALLLGNRGCCSGRVLFVTFTQHPSISMKQISVPHPTIHSFVTLCPSATAVVVLAGFSSSAFMAD